jgi:hypothetical protein
MRERFPLLPLGEPIPPSMDLSCPQCGYNLTGLTGRRCPECGTKFDVATAQRANRESRYEHQFSGTGEAYAVVGIIIVVLVLIYLAFARTPIALIGLLLPLLGEFAAQQLEISPALTRAGYLALSVAWVIIVFTI